MRFWFFVGTFSICRLTNASNGISRRSANPHIYLSVQLVPRHTVIPCGASPWPHGFKINGSRQLCSGLFCGRFDCTYWRRPSGWVLCAVGHFWRAFYRTACHSNRCLLLVYCVWALRPNPEPKMNSSMHWALNRSFALLGLPPSERRRVKGHRTQADLDCVEASSGRQRGLERHRQNRPNSKYAYEPVGYNIALRFPTHLDIHFANFVLCAVSAVLRARRFTLGGME